MKKINLLFTIGILSCHLLYGQTPLNIEIKEKKEEAIYLDLKDKKELEFATEEGGLDAKKNVNAKDNSINIYLKWINPLKYKLTWKDSTLNDKNDKAINDFISSLAGQFGTQVTVLNNEEMDIQEPASPTGDNIVIRNFNNVNLYFFMWHLINLNSLINRDEGEVEKINSLTKKLENLDKLNSIIVSDEVSNIYTSLMSIDNIAQFNIDYPKQLDKVKKLEGDSIGFEKIEELEKEIVSDLKEFNLSNMLLDRFTKTVVNNYIEIVRLTLGSNKKIVSKLKPVMEIIINSTKNKSDNTVTQDYYRVRSVEFDNGQVLETTITFSEFEFDANSKEFSKKKEILAKKLIFQKYDVFDIFFTTGIFLTNTTLNGFGVSNDEDNNFIVTKDDIESNNPIPALFLNFDFHTSRYLSPLLQIGIDPTKNRPFMLLGGGFSIPVARIALSGGAIWTWNQTLDNLKVGQVINSTTELDDDIKYKFEAKPKGWYLGIQYKF